MIDAISPAAPAPDLRPDLRDATRATLLIRSAKLVCRSGEYICLVRDVSSTGVRLRLFHALPPETRVSLVLANGSAYPMEKRWTQPDPAGGEQAGFRFVQPIDVDSFIEEASPFSRRPIRLALECHGRLFSQGQAQGQTPAPAQATPMILRNLSQGGACIETIPSLALHQTVRLAIDGLPERFAQVRWRRRADHGLAFDQAFRLDELARHAQVLQPFAVGSPVATKLGAPLMARAVG